MNTSEWKKIETAPKDGTWILAFGLATKDLAIHGNTLPNLGDEKKHPFQTTVKWVEGWYDKEVPVKNGMYKKVKTKSFAYWDSVNIYHYFTPTHWMPLPDAPK